MTTSTLIYVGSGSLSSFTDLHVEGGVMFMVPLSIMFALNIGLILYGSYLIIQKKTFHQRWLDTIKQIGGLAAAWGAWSTIIGFFFMFDAIEGSKETIPIQVISGGVKVGLITVLYGLLILCLSMLASIILRLANRPSAA